MSPKFIEPQNAQELYPIFAPKPPPPPPRQKDDDDDTMVHVHPPLQLEQIPKEDEERLEKLFAQLDKDGNGKIDIHDLSEALKELAPHINRSYAEKFLAKPGWKEGGDVTLSEFMHYVREHEKNLRLQFSHLDKNKDGKVDVAELIDAFADMGIAVAESEATNLLKRMDQDGSLTISYDEWRDYMLLAPATDIHSLIHFWRHSTSKREFLAERRCRMADVYRLQLMLSWYLLLVKVQY